MMYWLIAYLVCSLLGSIYIWSKSRALWQQAQVPCRYLSDKSAVEIMASKVEFPSLKRQLEEELSQKRPSSSVNSPERRARRKRFASVGLDPDKEE